MEVRQNKKFRQARTRQLIQIGGLVEKAGLLTEINLPSDMDLQLGGPVAKDAAAILYGMLLEQFQQLEGSDDKTACLTKWRLAGKDAFKNQDLS